MWLCAFVCVCLSEALSQCIFLSVSVCSFGYTSTQINEIFVEKEQQSTITSRLFRHGYKRFSEFVLYLLLWSTPFRRRRLLSSLHSSSPKIVFVRSLPHTPHLPVVCDTTKSIQAIFIMIYFCFYSIFVISLACSLARSLCVCFCARILCYAVLLLMFFRWQQDK